MQPTQAKCNQKCSLIIAEDNPLDVRLVREALREHEVDCEEYFFSDGEQVISFIDRLDRDSRLPCPDLLLLDFFLPKYDAAVILQHLRSTERCARTPVIVMTSSDSRGHREIAEKHAVVHYFTKPNSLDGFRKLGALVKRTIAL